MGKSRKFATVEEFKAYRRQYHKDWVAAHPGYKAKDVAKRVKTRKFEMKSYAGERCMICGYDFCNGALEFHHLDPTTKTREPSRLKTVSWERATKEMDTCILVCANCHREIHEGLIPTEGLLTIGQIYKILGSLDLLLT